MNITSLKIHIKELPEESENLYRLKSIQKPNLCNVIITAFNPRY